MESGCKRQAFEIRAHAYRHTTAHPKRKLLCPLSLDRDGPRFQGYGTLHWVLRAASLHLFRCFAADISIFKRSTDTYYSCLRHGLPHEPHKSSLPMPTCAVFQVFQCGKLTHFMLLPLLRFICSRSAILVFSSCSGQEWLL